jgi:hypothetical protein
VAEGDPITGASRTDPPVRTLAQLETVLDGAALLGLELDTRYRVLAVTLEPTRERYPWGSGSDSVVVVDRRVQLLLSPVSTILGSLRRRGVTGERERTEVLTFTDEQLVDIAGALDGAPVLGPLFGRPEPRPGSWAPEWSLEGRSTAGDGITHTVTLSARSDDGGGELALDLFARFDEVLVRDARGSDLFRTGPSASGPLDLGPA